MKYFYKSISLILLLNVISMSLQAGTYYVDDNGAASWEDCEHYAGTPGPKSGTDACNLATANSNAAAGDTVWIREGTYNTSLKPSNSGSSENVILFKAYTGETPTITNIDEGEAGIYLKEVDYIKIDGIKVDDVWRLGTIEGGSNYNEIVNCTLHKGSANPNSGIVIRSFNNEANTHNWIHNCTIYEAGFVNQDDCQDQSNLIKLGTTNYDHISNIILNGVKITYMVIIRYN